MKQNTLALHDNPLCEMMGEELLSSSFGHLNEASIIISYAAVEPKEEGFSVPIYVNQVLIGEWCATSGHEYYDGPGIFNGNCNSIALGFKAEPGSLWAVLTRLATHLHVSVANITHRKIIVA